MTLSAGIAFVIVSCGISTSFIANSVVAPTTMNMITAKIILYINDMVTIML